MTTNLTLHLPGTKNFPRESTMTHLTTIAALLACCLCALELGAAPAQSPFEMAVAVGTGGATAPPTFPTGSQTNSAPGASVADQYWMDLTLDPAHGRMKGKMRLCYRNNSTKPLPALRLRLDPNLDTKQTLEIAAVTDLMGADLPWSYRNLKFAGWASENGALEVVLPAPLAPGGKTVFSVQFHGVGSYINTNMSVLQDDPYHSLDGWYPKAMTPRGDGWSIDDDRLSDYEIGVKLPADIAVASTGRRLGKEKRGSQAEWRLKAERVRGFTIYGSSSWQRHERRAGQVDLAICVPAEAKSWVQRLLDATADSIAFYEKEYGPFPTRHLDITCPGVFSERAHGSWRPAT